MYTDIRDNFDYNIDKFNKRVFGLEETFHENRKAIRHTFTKDDRVFESVNRFGKTRTLNDLKILDSFFLDLDVRKVDGNMDLNIKEYIDTQCNTHNLPYPSVVMNSGNGYHLYWHLESKNGKLGLDKSMLKLWNHIQHKLADCFSKYADRQALDATRVLAQPFSPTKDGGMVTPMFGGGENYSYTLFTHLLDYSYEEVQGFLNLTKKQIKLFEELQNEGLLSKDLDVNNFNKKTIVPIIKSAFGKKPATSKQTNTIKQYLKKDIDVNFDTLTCAEADMIIKTKIFPSQNYMMTFLDTLFKNGDIQTGNKTYFVFYMTKAFKNLNKNLNADEILNEIQTLYPANYDKHIIDTVYSALRDNSSNFIKKETMLETLNLNNKYYIKKVGHKRILTLLSDAEQKELVSKEKVQNISKSKKRTKASYKRGQALDENFKKNIITDIYRAFIFNKLDSQRKIANKYNVSLGTVNKLIKEMKKRHKENFKTQQLKKFNAKKFFKSLSIKEEELKLHAEIANTSLENFLNELILSIENKIGLHDNGLYYIIY